LSVIQNILGGNGGNPGGGTSTSTPMTGASLTPASVSIMSGQSVDFNGRGFGSEEDVTITRNGTQVGMVHADGGGNFSTGSMTITGSSTTTYTFTGNRTGTSRTSTITFTNTM
jgi:hypothetical protein